MVRDLVSTVIEELRKSGFRVSHRKIKVMGPGDRKTLTKLILGKLVSVDKKYLKRLRAGIHNLQCGRVLEHRDEYVRSLEGSISYVALLQPTTAVKLKDQLANALLILKTNNAPRGLTA
jgi:hypothetical protein